MKKNIYIIAFLLVSSFTKLAVAQDNDAYFNFYYSMGQGLGETKDFISKYSWRGVGFNYRAELSDNVMAGVGADWNVFYEKMPYATYTLDNAAVSGKQYRYLNMFPMTARLDYFKDTEKGYRFIAGAGIGSTYFMQDVDMGSYRLNTNTWQFLIAPEVGVTYDLDANRSLLLSVKYNANFKNTELTNRSYLSFNIGFAFNQ
ncbi:MAG: hypothetical protein CFE21_08760 [Bacteroidetes bacterium B1(2017)]|nr:MAG: hypothetical protein CFE21_08760 [Bacteroidetes bacterium B1(2017)]